MQVLLLVISHVSCVPVKMHGAALAAHQANKVMFIHIAGGSVAVLQEVRSSLRQHQRKVVLKYRATQARELREVTTRQQARVEDQAKAKLRKSSKPLVTLM